MADKETRDAIVNFYAAAESQREVEEKSSLTKDATRANDAEDESTTAPRAPRELRIIDLRPFLAGAALSPDDERELSDDMLNLIVETVESESWAQTGGDEGSMWVLPGARLAIVHDAGTLSRIQALVDALLAMRAAPVAGITRAVLPGGDRPISLIDVRALVPPDELSAERASDCVDSLIEMIDPESWRRTGGERFLRFYGGTILTDAADDRAEQGTKLLEAIREVGALPTLAPAHAKQVEAGARPLMVYDMRGVVEHLSVQPEPSADQAPRQELVEPWDAISELIMAQADPADWVNVGGDAAFLRPDYSTGAMIIHAHASTHKKIEVIVAKMRADAAAAPSAEARTKQIRETAPSPSAEETDAGAPGEAGKSGTVGNAGAAASGADAPAPAPISTQSSGESASESKPRGFTAEELNRVSARLDDRLFVLGIYALAETEADSVSTIAAESGAASTGAANTSTAKTGDAPNGATLDRVGAAAADAPRRKIASEPVTVVARFAQLDVSLDRALAALGAEVEARAPSTNVLVLRVPYGKLIDLAALGATRRVEPLVLEAATPNENAAGRR